MLVMLGDILPPQPGLSICTWAASVNVIKLIPSTEILTNLEDVGDGALLQQPHALAVGGVLVLQGVGDTPAGRAVHPDVPLVSREGPEHQSLLDWLRNSRESFLYSLEWNSFGNKFWRDVKESARRHSLDSFFSVSSWSWMFVCTVALVTAATTSNIPRASSRHLHNYWNILNRYIDTVECHTRHRPPHSLQHWGLMLVLSDSACPTARHCWLVVAGAELFITAEAAQLYSPPSTAPLSQLTVSTWLTTRPARLSTNCTVTVQPSPALSSPVQSSPVRHSKSSLIVWLCGGCRAQTE